jgi:hypothetical protein
MRPRWWAGCVASLLLLTSSRLGLAQGLDLPARAPQAPGGQALVRQIADLSLPNRETVLEREIRSGNVPDFYRHFCPVSVTNVLAGQTNVATFYAAPDYLAVGTDADYFITPLSPATAQRLADSLSCRLPTPRMVDAIYRAAPLKLAPAPIPPSPAMTTVAVFARHNALVQAARKAWIDQFPLGTLVAGNHKDVVITARLTVPSRQVAIYGWHQTNGVPIQPLYTGHRATWVDYSQGIRLVQRALTVNGRPATLPEVLADPQLCQLLSAEGMVTNGAYATNGLAR